MYKVTQIENQKIVWASSNDITRTIFYDTRIAISAPREIPVVWSCSKVEDMNVKGIARYTFKQDLFNDQTDVIEKDEDGNVIGIWCDLNKSGIPIPSQEQPHQVKNIRSEITYTGVKPELKIGGNFKTFTVSFYNESDQIDTYHGFWSFIIDGQDASSLVETKEVSDNQLKIKFIGSDDYISKNIIISHTADCGIKSSVTMNIVGL